MQSALRSITLVLVAALLPMCSPQPVATGIAIKQNAVRYNQGNLSCVKHDGLLLARVKVNDQPCWMVVDTGASDTVLRKDWVMAHVPQAQIISLDGVFRSNARQHLFGVQVKSISSSVFRADDVMLMMLELGQLGNYKGEPIAGLLGMDIVGAHVLSLDMKSGNVAIMMQMPSASALSAQGGVRVPIRFDNKRAAAEVRANGFPQLLLIDTGATNTQILERLWRGETRRLNASMTVMDVNGINRQTSLRVAMLQSLSWGAASLPLKAAVLDNSLGIMGGDILNRGKLLVDLRRPEAWWLPH